jgi:hypothetical protein
MLQHLVLPRHPLDGHRSNAGSALLAEGSSIIFRCSDEPSDIHHLVGIASVAPILAR